MKPHFCFLFVLFCLLPALAGCAGPAASLLGGPTPTFIPPAPSPVIAEVAFREPASTVAVGDATATPSPDAAVAMAVEAPPPAGTAAPTPIGSGEEIRPGEARLYRPVAEPLEATPAWRPPPVTVPLSLHPDDHYWLRRPIPSDSRNYDLEWYPYGNDVLLEEHAPYKIHRGLDFPNETGTPILAASSGTVVHSGPLRSRLDGINYYGNTVIIQHDWQWQGKDVYTLYAHALELFVDEGDRVEQGQLIAGVGRSGIVSGPHLHLEVRIGKNTYNHTYNPALWLAPFEGWGTLAGRLVDIRGDYVYGGWVGVYPLNVETAPRGQYTYLIEEVRPDDVWQENFVFGDLPAGRYRVVVKAGGREYQNTVEVLPGRTNFVIIQTDFVYAPPTETPTPTATPPPPAADDAAPTATEGDG